MVFHLYVLVDFVGDGTMDIFTFSFSSLNCMMVGFFMFCLAISIMKLIDFSPYVFHRISGLQLMIAEPFFCPFRVYWEVCLLFPSWSSLQIDKSGIFLFLCSPNYIVLLHAEPNPESPLNSYAAALLNNKEGWIHILMLSLSLVY